MTSATGFRSSANAPSLGNACPLSTVGRGSSKRSIERPIDQEKLRHVSSCAAASAAPRKGEKQATTPARGSARNPPSSAPPARQDHSYLEIVMGRNPPHRAGLRAQEAGREL